MASVSYPRASTATLEHESPSANVRGVRLEVVAGPDAGLAIRSRGDRVVIGADRAADLVLSDATVSRFHCEVVLTREGVRVRDLDSRNGTLIEGVAIESARVDRGATISLGRTLVRCQLIDQDEQVIDAAEAAAADTPPIDTSVPIRRAREQWVHFFERCYLADLLAETNQNVTAAARRAGIDRVHMHRLLSRAGLR